MAFRLRLVPENTNWDFFRFAKYTFGISAVAVIGSILAALIMGFNFGIDFLGGTTIRTEARNPIDIGAYRQAIDPLDFGDVTLTEVFDPTFGAERNVALIRIQGQDGQAALTQDMIGQVEAVLKGVDPTITFQSVETVGPKVSGELIWTAVLSLALSLVGVMIYVWLRFEWQFGVASVAALTHDVIATVGIFAVTQMKFDLTIVAALLTIVGYSINDTVVIFDRVRENLIKYKKRSVKDIVNLSLNETLSRTVMTTMTVLLALLALYIFGGDVIRGFAFAMIWGVILGCYSTVFVASVVLIWLGVNREKAEKADPDAADNGKDAFGNDIPARFLDKG